MLVCSNYETESLLRTSVPIHTEQHNFTNYSQSKQMFRLVNKAPFICKQAITSMRCNLASRSKSTATALIGKPLQTAAGLIPTSFTEDFANLAEYLTNDAPTAIAKSMITMDYYAVSSSNLCLIIIS